MSYLRYSNINGSDDNPVFLNGPVEDFIKSIGDGVRAGEDVIAGGGSQALEDALRSTAFGQVLDAVEAKAREGVKAEAGKNALGLFGLALGAGTVGGAVLTGKVGLMLAAGVMAGSLIFIMRNANATAKK